MITFLLIIKIILLSFVLPIILYLTAQGVSNYKFSHYKKYLRVWFDTKGDILGIQSVDFFRRKRPIYRVFGHGGDSVTELSEKDVLGNTVANKLYNITLKAELIPSQIKYRQVFFISNIEEVKNRIAAYLNRGLLSKTGLPLCFNSLNSGRGL